MNQPSTKDGALSERQKTGYLNQEFRFFHLKDQKQMTFPYHYHDFCKIVCFLSGQVTYFIEGKAYFLQPKDILLINQYDLHRPVVKTKEPYERIVIWLRSDYLRKLSNEESNLSDCFKRSCETGYHLIRLNQTMLAPIMEQFAVMETCLTRDKQEFGASLLLQNKLSELLIYLNRYNSIYTNERDNSALLYDKRIEDLMQYITNHLDEDLSIDLLSKRFYISRYYLMRKFKTETGFTLHNYIIKKRLFHALEQMRRGVPVTNAAMESGFLDYSVFFKAFKRQFGCLPSEYEKIDSDTIQHFLSASDDEPTKSILFP